MLALLRRLLSSIVPPPSAEPPPPPRPRPLHSTVLVYPNFVSAQPRWDYNMLVRSTERDSTVPPRHEVTQS